MGAPLKNDDDQPILGFGFDWVTILLYVGFVLAGWICIYAAVYDPKHPTIFDLSTSYGKQALFIGISFLIAFIIMLSDVEIYGAFAWLLYVVTLLLCIAVIFVGGDIKGAKSWFALGGFGIQPSEFAKFAVSLALARYLSGYGIKFKDTSTKLICAAIIMAPMAVILLQNDTGSALVYLSFSLVLFREGLPGYLLMAGVIVMILAILSLLINTWWLIGTLTVLFLLGAFLMRGNWGLIGIAFLGLVLSSGIIYSTDYVFNNVLQEHQRNRINVLFGKVLDLKGVGWNVHQSKIAIGSGGLLGKGFLQGTQTKFNFVPEQSTDFIFCTVGEEYGFLGSTLVVGGFVFLLFRLVRIAERQRNKFSRVYAYCVTSILFFHFMVNIGMTLGVLPVIGIPLPFFSYGGSSLISFTILLFILIKLDSNRVNELRSYID